MESYGTVSSIVQVRDGINWHGNCWNPPRRVALTIGECSNKIAAISCTCFAFLLFLGGSKFTWYALWPQWQWNSSRKVVFTNHNPSSWSFIGDYTALHMKDSYMLVQCIYTCFSFIFTYRLATAHAAFNLIQPVLILIYLPHLHFPTICHFQWLLSFRFSWL